MKTQDIYIAHPKTDEESKALKAFLQALKIEFEIPGAKEYNAEFVKKELESRQQVKDGKVTRVEKENLKLSEELKEETGQKTESDRIQTHFASEKALAKDWLLPEEDEAWKDL